jgi:hypothetical protein
MPLLEITQIRYVIATIRLNETTATLIDQYATFVSAAPDDVVDTALTYIFAKDRDFQEFLRTPQAAAIQPLLRVRRASNAAPSDARGGGRKSAAGVESLEVVRRETAQKA